MDDPDDDTHICLKCRMTITGLENYVAHRKSGCFDINDPCLKADAFFSLLELQSSSKKPQEPKTTVTRSKPLTEGEEDGKIGDWSTPLLDEERDFSWEYLRWDSPTQRLSKSVANCPPPVEVSPVEVPEVPLGDVPEELQQDEENERSIMAPPPSHTRGKWAPGMEARKSGSSVQYWCGPCNRRLSSRSLYERHLLSELHFKRTLPKPQESTPPRDRRKKRASPPPPQLANRRTRDAGRLEQCEQTCSVCGARVFKHQIGKHLVSHYHWRGMQRAVARAASKTAADALIRTAHKMVLANIHAVVRQAPFQCAMCRFYSNTSITFRQHWSSQMHLQKESETEGEFWCWPCDITHATSAALLEHLTSPEHMEVEAALNRTLPVIVRRRLDQHCAHPGCGRSFRLNIQLQHHQKAEGHFSRLRCGSCGVAKKNHLALQKHVIRAHPVDVSKDGGPVFCARTQRLFPCAAAASAAVAEVNVKTAPKPRRCPHCDIVLPSVTALLIHLEKRHPDLVVRCARCSAAFALPQQVTRHVRDGQCSEHLSRRQGQAETPQAPGTATPQVDTNQPKSLACATCPYRSDSKAELLYHQLLHAGSSPPFRCPVEGCDKEFQRATSIRYHIRTHTGERPFECSSCPAAFTRRYSLAAHRRQNHPQGKAIDWRAAEVILGPGPETQLCAVCGKCLRDRATLRQHMAVHQQRRFECGQAGCQYRATSAAKLRRHQRSHSDERPFACDHCAFATKSQPLLQRHMMVHTGTRPHSCPHCPFTSRLSLHLKRHMRVHTGAKPYKCPHCPYRCNVMENLRKHVLSTKRHPLKKLYECHECDQFATNSAKEIQSHLIGDHSEKFSTAAEASAYTLAAIYNPEADSATIDHEETVETVDNSSAADSELLKQL